MCITRTFFIAEVGVNHNNDLELAKQLIDTAKDAGADAVKFQSFSAEELVTNSAKTAQYQQNNTQETHQYQMLKSLELSEEAHHILFEHCQKRQIEFMSTAFSPSWLSFLVDLGIKRIKVPSGEITNHFLLDSINEAKLPIILSTGMSELSEIESALSHFTHQQPITLLHCTSNYPTAISDVNLNAMQTMAEKFKFPVGYSDHTDGTLVASLAIAKGATIIEKHITLDRSLPGPDHKASIEPETLKRLIADIRLSEQAMGSYDKHAVKNELAVRAAARRSLTLSKSLPAGTSISENDLCLMRPGNGIEPKHWQNVLGKTLKVNKQTHQTLHWRDLENA